MSRYLCLFVNSETYLCPWHLSCAKFVAIVLIAHSFESFTISFLSVKGMRETFCHKFPNRYTRNLSIIVTNNRTVWGREVGVFFFYIVFLSDWAWICQNGLLIIWNCCLTASLDVNKLLSREKSDELLN